MSCSGRVNAYLLIPLGLSCCEWNKHYLFIFFQVSDKNKISFQKFVFQIHLNTEIPILISDKNRHTFRKT